MTSLEQEFGLPFASIEKLGKAYQQHTLNSNNYGSNHTNHELVRPSNFYSICADLKIEVLKGQQIGWAYICEQ